MNTQFETANAGNAAGTHTWLTPPELLAKLGTFDVDPCAAPNQPWRTATTQYTEVDDGLAHTWHGRVWCNPPYGKYSATWLRRCAEHGNAIALVFARTETKAFHDYVWPHAHTLLFIKGRLSFRLASGGEAGTAGAPSVLIAYDQTNADILRASRIPGAIVQLKGLK